MAALPSTRVPVEVITNLLDGGVEATARRRFVRTLVEAHPVLDIAAKCTQNHEQQYIQGLAKVRARTELIRAHNLTQRWDRKWLKAAIADDLPTDLHDLAFVPYIESQADEEQCKLWLPLARSYGMIGAYAQTELGCGSNVSALATTATFRRDTDSFELHTPNDTARKWWPGALGCTATHAIVMARLIVPAASGRAHTDHGVHAFLVQLRDAQHAPLPGITLGDIGPKLGFNAMDNGWLRLDHVVIPRFNMLRRFTLLHTDGRYERRGHDKVAYAGMTFIRCAIVSGAGRVLAKAATIATRYTHVRGQFDARPRTHPHVIEEVAAARGAERATSVAIASIRSPVFAAPPARLGGLVNRTPVFTYALVHGRLVPQIVTAYALYATGEAMLQQYFGFEESMRRGDFSGIAEVHATSAALKSLSTQLAADGIEVCRRTCGGQGYSSASGLGELWSSYVAVCTAEGDNPLMQLQAARFLLKSAQAAAAQRPLPDSVRYLATATDRASELSRCTTARQWLGWTLSEAPEDPLLVALQLVASALIKRAASTVLAASTSASTEADSSAGDSLVNAFATAQDELHTAAVAHGLVYAASALHAAAERIEEPTVARLYRWMCTQFTCAHVCANAAVLLEEGIIAPSQAADLRAAGATAMAVVKEFAVPLTGACVIAAVGLTSNTWVCV